MVTILVLHCRSMSLSDPNSFDISSSKCSLLACNYDSISSWQLATLYIILSILALMRFCMALASVSCFDSELKSRTTELDDANLT